MIAGIAIVLIFQTIAMKKLREEIDELKKRAEYWEDKFHREKIARLENIVMGNEVKRGGANRRMPMNLVNSWLNRSLLN